MARQAAQILELQGEVTKAQVTCDRSAQRQTEANAQLTRQDSTVSRYAATNTQLQDQLQEAQTTAASQHHRIAHLQSELAESSHHQLRSEKQCARLEAETQQQQQLAAERASEAQKLQAQLDESAAAVASATAAEKRLQGQLQVQLEEHCQQKKQYEEELEGLRAFASTSASKQESLQAEVPLSRPCQVCTSTYHGTYMHVVLPWCKLNLARCLAETCLLTSHQSLQAATAPPFDLLTK